MGDEANTNVAFTVREIDEDVPIAALANREASIDVLELAGCDEVIHLADLLGPRAWPGGSSARMRRPTSSASSATCASPRRASTAPSWSGSTLREAAVRQRARVNVVGLWQEGHFVSPTADTRLAERTVLILAGSAQQLAAYDAEFGVERQLERPVLDPRWRDGWAGPPHGHWRRPASTPRIVEQRPERIRDEFTSVLGDAAALEVLRTAGLDDAAAVLVTTHEDDVNVYLTLYLRRLRPDVQVIARATRDRNVSTLHRAGADAVLSYASIGATAMWNAMGGASHRLVIAEGLEMFRVPIPDQLRGRSLDRLRASATHRLPRASRSPTGTARAQPRPGRAAARTRWTWCWSGTRRARSGSSPSSATAHGAAEAGAPAADGSSPVAAAPCPVPTVEPVDHGPTEECCDPLPAPSRRRPNACGRDRRPTAHDLRARAGGYRPGRPRTAAPS